MRCVAITGAELPVVAAVASKLSEVQGVEQILYIGERAPAQQPPKLTFVQRAGRAPLADVFLERWVEGVIHLAWGSEAAAEDVAPSVDRILEACHRAGVQRAVIGSTAMVYGPSWDRPAPRKEGSPLEGARLGSPVVKALVEAEGRIEAFAAEHPEVELVVSRPCRVVGPGVEDELSRLLARGLTPLPSPMAPVQVMHAEDYGGALVALLLGSARGACNVAPDVVLGPDELAEAAAGRVVFLPGAALERALATGQRWGVPTGRWTPERLRYLCEPWLADGRRLSAQTGFRFSHPPASALAEAVREAARVGSGSKGSMLPRLLGR